MSYPVGGNNLGVLLTAAQMQDPTGSSSSSPTIATQEQNELKLVRLRLRQAPSEPRSRTRSPSPVENSMRPPVPVDLVCREKLTPEREQTGPTGLADRKRGLDAAPASLDAGAGKKTGDRFSEQDTDHHYWEKHKVLVTMMGGFAGMLVRKLEECPRARKLTMCAVIKETKATQPPGALKTKKDLEVLDTLIYQACRSHSMLVCNELKRRRVAREEREAKEAQLRAV